MVEQIIFGEAFSRLCCQEQQRFVQPTEPAGKFGVDGGFGHKRPKLPPEQLAIGRRVQHVFVNGGELIGNRDTGLCGLTFTGIVIAGVKALQLLRYLGLAKTIARRLPDDLFRKR